MKILRLAKFAPRLWSAGKDVQTKGWYTSKTIWLNLLILAADVALRVFDLDLPVTGEEIDALAVGFAAIGNIALRCVTDKPIGVRTEREAVSPVERPKEGKDDAPLAVLRVEPALDRGLHPVPGPTDTDHVQPSAPASPKPAATSGKLVVDQGFGNK